MIWVWLGFIAFILMLLALDLGVFHRKAHVVSMREALGWSAVWITLGLLFSIPVYFGYENHWMGMGKAVDVVDGTINDGSAAVIKYLTGYVVEKSLSVDNVFVIAMIFGAMAVPPIYQHRVLFWGILGALIMRGLMIGIGATLIARFHWILYVFGVFLIFTAVKMLFVKSHDDPTDNAIVRLVRRWVPVTEHFHGEHFFVKAGSTASHEKATATAAPEPDALVAKMEQSKPGAWMITPLLLTLILVEFTDVIFAVDSIPAIFAITADPFLVFTSNVFAILGLRALYFALAGLIDKFRYLKVALALVLAVVGAKMLAAEYLKHAIGQYFNLYLLAVVLLLLAGGVVASLIANRRDENAKMRLGMQS